MQFYDINHFIEPLQLHVFFYMAQRIISNNNIFLFCNFEDIWTHFQKMKQIKAKLANVILWSTVVKPKAPKTQNKTNKWN